MSRRPQDEAGFSSFPPGAQANWPQGTPGSSTQLGTACAARKGGQRCPGLWVPACAFRRRPCPVVVRDTGLGTQVVALLLGAVGPGIPCGSQLPYL